LQHQVPCAREERTQQLQTRKHGKTTKARKTTKQSNCKHESTKDNKNTKQQNRKKNAKEVVAALYRDLSVFSFVFRVSVFLFLFALD
jgi:hypothetical protein